MTAGPFSMAVALVTVSLTMAGCDKFGQQEKDALISEKVMKLENRVSILEAQIAQVSIKPAAPESWVLWKRFVANGPTLGVGYTPFQAVSAFDSRSDCMTQARLLITPGGRFVTTDPLSVDYENGRQEFACLPKGVVAGIQLSK